MTCKCKDASRKNSCKGLPNCSLRADHPERKVAATETNRPAVDKATWVWYAAKLEQVITWIRANPSGTPKMPERPVAPAEDVRAMVDEPVAWAENSDLAKIEKGAIWSGTLWGQSNPPMLAVRSPLYRHGQRKPQCSEVAAQCSELLRTQRQTVIPERELYMQYLAGVIPSNAVEANAYKDGWNACLDELKRLNGEQP